MFIINCPTIAILTALIFLILVIFLFFVKKVKWLDTIQDVSRINEKEIYEEEIPDGREIFMKAIRGELRESEYLEFCKKSALRKKKSAQIKVPKITNEPRFKTPKGW